MKDNKFLGFKFLDYFDVLLNKTTGNEMYKVSYNVTNNSLPFVLTETNLTNGTVFGLKAKCQYDIYFKKTNNNLLHLMDVDNKGYAFLYDEEDNIWVCKLLGLTASIENEERQILIYIKDSKYDFRRNEEDGNYYIFKIFKGQEGEITISRDENNRITSIVKELKIYGELKEELNFSYQNNKIELIYKKYDLEKQYIYLNQDSNKNIIRIYTLTNIDGVKQFDYSITRGNNILTFKDEKYNVSDSLTYSATNKVITDKFGKTHSLTCTSSKCIFTDYKGEQTTYIFDERGNTNHITDEYNELQLTMYNDDLNLQSESSIDLKCKAKLGEELIKEEDWIVGNGRKEYVTVDSPFDGSEEVWAILTMDETMDSYTYREDFDYSGKREQVRSFLFHLAGNGTSYEGTSLQFHVEYYDYDDNLLESSEIFKMENYGEEKYYAFSTYCHQDYAYFEVVVYVLGGVSNALFKIYAFEGGIGKTYRYDKFGRVYEVIDGKNIIREYRTKLGTPIGAGNVLIYYGTNVTYDVIDDGLGNNKIVLKYNKPEPLGLVTHEFKRYGTKEVSQNKTEYQEDTDLIDNIESNDENIKYEYDDNKILKKVIVQDSSGIDKMTYKYEYSNHLAFHPEELKSVEILNTENEIVAKNGLEVTNNLPSYINYSMRNDNLIVLKKIDKYKRDIEYSKYGLKISEIEYDLEHNAYVSRQDNYYYFYNEAGLLISIAYEESSNIIFTIEYDENKNILRVVDLLNNITKDYFYSYGELDHITYKKNNEEIETIKYIKNEKQGLKAEEQSYEETNCYKEYVGQVKETSNIYDLYAYVASKDKNIYTTFFISKIVELNINASYSDLNDELYFAYLFNEYNNKSVKFIDDNAERYNLEYEKIDGINCVDLRQFNAEYNSMKMNSIGFFLRLNGTCNGEKEIIAFQDVRNHNNYFSLCLNGDKLKLKAKFQIKEQNIELNAWNFVYLERDENNELKLFVNNEEVLTINNISDIYNSGYLKIVSCGTANNSILMTGLMVSETILEETFRKEVYARFKEIERIEENSINRDQIETSPYAITQAHIKESTIDIDYASLHSDLRTKQGKESLNTLRYDKNSNIKNFIFDEKLNSYVFNKMGPLTYRLSSLESGTISINLRHKDVIGTGFKILTIRDRTKERFVLKTTNLGIGLEVDGNSVGDSYQEDNLWHRYTITWNKVVASESMEGIQYVVKAYKDGTLISDEVGFELTSDIDTFLYLYVADESNQGKTLLEGLYIGERALSESEVRLLSTSNKVNIVKEYNTSGNIISKTINKNGVNITNIEYSYDDSNRLCSIIGQNNEICNEYNNKNLIIKVDSELCLATYEYDDIDRLVKEENRYDDDNNEITNKYQYEYDTRGNISKILLNGEENKTFAYDTFNKLIKYNNERKANGELYKDGRFLYPSRINKIGGYVLLEWSKNRLIKYSEYNNSNVLQFEETYTYDINGLRLSKTHNRIGSSYTSSYIYDEQGKLVKEERVRGTTKDVFLFYYDSKDQLECFSLNGTMYFYLRDTKQDIYAIIDSSGTIVGSYVYDAFGNILYQSGGIAQINPFKYKGYYYDVETQLYWVSSRYYSPELCRWISPDSIGYLDPQSINGLNLYCYCMNNPVNYSDGSGHSPEWNWGTFFKGLALVGTAIGAIAVSVATFGLATPLAMTIVAGVTLGAGVLTGINGVATMIEAGTDYNFVRDGLFNEVLGLSDTAYDWYAGITEGVAIVGTAICTIWNITNPIKGFTDHGRQSALTHDGHGVNARAMQNAVRNPLKVVNQTNGGIKHIGKNAVVVLNKAGKVITTYAKSHYGWRMMLALWLGSELF